MKYIIPLLAVSLAVSTATSAVSRIDAGTCQSSILLTFPLTSQAPIPLDGRRTEATLDTMYDAQAHTPMRLFEGEDNGNQAVLAKRGTP